MSQSSHEWVQRHRRSVTGHTSQKMAEFILLYCVQSIRWMRLRLHSEQLTIYYAFVNQQFVWLRINVNSGIVRFSWAYLPSGRGRLLLLLVLFRCTSDVYLSSKIRSTCWKKLINFGFVPFFRCRCIRPCKVFFHGCLASCGRILIRPSGNRRNTETGETLICQNCHLRRT